MNGDLRGGDIAQGLGHEPGRDPELPGLVHLVLGRGEMVDAGGSRAQGDEKPPGRGGGVQAAHGQSLLGGGVGELHKGHGLPGEALGQQRGGVEVLDLGGHLDRNGRGVALGDGRDAADAVNQIVPIGLYTDADGGHSPHAGNHNGLIHSIPSFPNAARTLRLHS